MWPDLLENLDELRRRARASLEEHGGVDPVAFERLAGLLRYVRGDYNDRATFQAIRKELDSARRPMFYLAIPPAMFEPVVEQLEKVGLGRRLTHHHRKAFWIGLSYGQGTQPHLDQHFS